MKLFFLYTSLILSISLSLIPLANSKNIEPDKGSIKNLDAKIKSLSTNIKYNCAKNARKAMCEQVLKSSDKSILLLNGVSKNNQAVQAKINNLSKTRNQTLKDQQKN